jgi:SAM-dependent methyltransferase
LSASPLPIEQIKASMRAQWMAGDFGMVAKTIARDGQDFVTRLALAPGTRVLDLACGTGNLAIPLARAGCLVTGLDIAPNLLVQARARAAAEGLSVQFDEGDAEALPYGDGSFDAVVSMFGAMFAPRPEAVVRECARVLRPGGLLAMANWNAEGFSGAMFRVNARHAPPPPGLEPPVRWGDPGTVRERLGGSFTDIRTELVPIVFDMPSGPREVVAFFRQYFGPTQTAFARLDATGQEALARDLEELWSKANTAEDTTRQTLVQNEYLEVRAQRR